MDGVDQVDRSEAKYLILYGEIMRGEINSEGVVRIDGRGYPTAFEARRQKEEAKRNRRYWGLT